MTRLSSPVLFRLTPDSAISRVSEAKPYQTPKVTHFIFQLKIKSNYFENI